ncbi:hypothetical protein Q3A80_02445 [Burkholderia sp. SR8]|uniref:hypothetical protein n=1 Tax=Burkholderia sp. SR8 TaxID=3062277 RepID=UPI004062A565
MLQVLNSKVTWLVERECLVAVKFNGAQNRRKPILPSLVLISSNALFENPMSAVDRGCTDRRATAAKRPTGQREKTACFARQGEPMYDRKRADRVSAPVSVSANSGIQKSAKVTGPPRHSREDLSCVAQKAVALVRQGASTNAD